MICPLLCYSNRTDNKSGFFRYGVRQVEASVVWAAEVTVAGFRNLFRCGHGQLDHSVIYGPTNVHVLTVAPGAGVAAADAASQQICRSASSRSFTFSTKLWTTSRNHKAVRREPLDSQKRCNFCSPLRQRLMCTNRQGHSRRRWSKGSLSDYRVGHNGTYPDIYKED